MSKIYQKERIGCVPEVLRKRPEVLRKRPSMNEFVNLFKYNNDDNQNQLCFKAMKKHKEKLLMINERTGYKNICFLLGLFCTRPATPFLY